MGIMESARAFVVQLYPNDPEWEKKVAEMPDRQVWAIFRGRKQKKHIQKEEKRTDAQIRLDVDALRYWQKVIYEEVN